MFMFQLYFLLTVLSLTLSSTNSEQYLAPYILFVYSQIWAPLPAQEVTSKLSLEALGQMRKTNP